MPRPQPCKALSLKLAPVPAGVFRFAENGVGSSQECFVLVIVQLREETTNALERLSQK